MARLATSLIALLTAGISVGGAQALAADYGEPQFPAMRGSIEDDPSEWTMPGDEGDALSFEAGVRYWYSMGETGMSDGFSDSDSTDTSHILEGHLRISDDFTRTYATAAAGYTVAINGEFDNVSGTGTLSSGHIGYAGADVGFMLLGDNDNGIGPMGGYLYWNDALETSRQNFTTATSAADISFDPVTGDTGVPMDSEPDNLHINAAKLGLGAHLALGERVDLTASAAAIPYARIQGTMGSAGPGIISLTPLGNIGVVQASPVSLDGWGYGGSAEVMLGFKPIENVAFRIGGRAMFLQGWADATYSIATISDPSDTDGDPLTVPNFEVPPTFGTQGIIQTANPFSMMRYGLLAELSYSF